MDAAGAAVTLWRRWNDTRRTSEALRNLDDRLLRDVGCDRSYLPFFLSTHIKDRVFQIGARAEKPSRQHP